MARLNLADDCAEFRKLDDATAGKTSCEVLRVMLTHLPMLVLPMLPTVP